MSATAPSFVCCSPAPAAHLSPFEAVVQRVLHDLGVSFFGKRGATPETIAAIVRRRAGGARLDRVERTLERLESKGLAVQVSPSHYAEARRGE